MGERRDRADRLQLAVHVQPRAGRDRVIGRHGDALKLHLAAPPLDNAANEACVRFVADLFRLRPAQVAILSGHRSRHKVLALAGDREQLERRLAELLAEPNDGTTTAPP